jgi:hypothetical protein
MTWNSTLFAPSVGEIHLPPLQGGTFGTRMLERRTLRSEHEAYSFEALSKSLLERTLIPEEH